MTYIPFQDDPHHLSSPSTVFEELLPMCSAIAILTFLLHQQGTVIIYVMSARLIANAIEKHIHISSLLLYNPPSHSTSFFIVLCSYIMWKDVLNSAILLKVLMSRILLPLELLDEVCQLLGALHKKPYSCCTQPRESKLETTVSLPPGKLQCKSNHIS
jgi:hypothetical protein